MNILNKQTITVVTASLLWFTAAGTWAAKQAGGGAGHMQRGIDLAQQKQYDAAIAEFTKAIAANPKDPRGYVNRGIAYRASGKAAEAAGDGGTAAIRYQTSVADFVKAVQLAPSDQEAYVQLGTTKMLQRDFEGAVADLEKAISLKPNDSAAYKVRGFARLRKKDYENAISDLSKAIGLKADDPEAYRWRAEAYRDSKQYELAVADYTAILSKSDPKSSDQAGLEVADFLAKRGYTYALMQQYQNAINDYEEAMRLNPKDIDTPQRLQYAQAMLAARNAPPPTATPTPTPEKGLITPLNVGIAIAVLVIIAIIWRVVTRGKAEETSGRIR